MIDVSDFKRGIAIVFKGAPMMIVSVSFSTPSARGAATIAKTRLRNLNTGALVTESIRSGTRYEEVAVESRPVTYLYGDGSAWHFMDSASFDQFELDADALGDATHYLMDGMEGIRAVVIDGKIQGIELPHTADLVITECDPAVKGATAAAQTKRAVLETGLEVQVPPYLQAGEKIRVDTRDGHFVERVKA
ncbi:MAG: elongation factor P [Planctomycetes bacterium]|nr:elongation factor P [Planctomycetota bacterium]